MKPKIIVRIAATLTALLAVVALAVLVVGAARFVGQEANSPQFPRRLGGLGLFAIMPGMFIWAAIQAWRGKPKGIVSLSSGWMLFGLGGSIVYLFWFFTDWKIHDALIALIWIGVFLFGVLIARQEKKMTLPT